jgi:ketosteroid isomerase-like protein
MPGHVPDVIAAYFEADARRDNEAIVALFTDDGVVVDEGETRHGVGEIREWRMGPASQYQYTTEVFDTERTSETEYRVTGRLEGNFPGGTADLTWRFTLAGDRISHLHIAP